jgi:uncharacterized coiled-coil DUF342 family protein
VIFANVHIDRDDYQKKLNDKVESIKEESNQFLEKLSEIHNFIGNKHEFKAIMTATQECINILHEGSELSEQIFNLQAQFETLEDKLSKLGI